jgi:23S rRNA (guanosine2251-2'-O)-methyltransferase
MPRPSNSESSSEEWIYGVHPVLELLEDGSRPIDKIVIAREAGGNLGRLLREARIAEVPVSRVPRPVLDRMLAKRNHQGVAARIGAVTYQSLVELTQKALSVPDGLLVLLDRVEDAGNLGAALRTCAAAGVDGVLLPSEGSAGITAGVQKASAGMAGRVPVARISRLRRSWDGLKAGGFRTAVLGGQGTTAWDKMDWSGPWILAAGGERDGVRSWLWREADYRVALPLAQGVESLNLSVALGVMLYERIRTQKDRNKIDPLAGSEGRC